MARSDPAMAAGLTDYQWTMRELLSSPIPLSPWVAPKGRDDCPSDFRPLSRSPHDRGSLWRYLILPREVKKPYMD